MKNNIFELGFVLLDPYVHVIKYTIHYNNDDYK